MSQIYDIGSINPTTTSPLTDITKLTNAMGALRTLFSGDSSPQETVPYMFWADTTEGILKRRNGDNDSWIFALSLTDDFIKEINTTYTTLASDAGNMLLVNAASSAITINLIAASSARAGSVIAIKKTDNTTNKVIITPNASETIDLHTDYQLQVSHETIVLRSDGNNWRIVNLYLPLVVLTKTATYAVQRSDDRAVINVNIATSTVTLPIISTVHNGFSVTIKKLIAGTTTIAPNGTTIDGSTANKTLTAVNQVTTLISNGSGWFVVNEANVPITFPSQTYATAAQMKAQTAGDIAVTPSVVQYSPNVNQVICRFNSGTNTTGVDIGVSSVQSLGVAHSRINFSAPFASVNTYAVVATLNPTTTGSTAAFIVTLEGHTASSVDARTFTNAGVPTPSTIVSAIASGRLA